MPTYVGVLLSINYMISYNVGFVSEISMNFLKVAQLSELQVDLDGRAFPMTISNMVQPNANIHIEDRRGGRLRLSLIKNHNEVLLFRVLNSPFQHIVYCVNIRVNRAKNTPNQITHSLCADDC